VLSAFFAMRRTSRQGSESQANLRGGCRARDVADSIYFTFSFVAVHRTVSKAVTMSGQAEQGGAFVYAQTKTKYPRFPGILYKWLATIVFFVAFALNVAVVGLAGWSEHV
jgi:hypothetical protein